MSVIFPTHEAWLCHWFHAACDRLKAAPRTSVFLYEDGKNWIASAWVDLQSGNGSEMARKIGKVDAIVKILSRGQHEIR